MLVCNSITHCFIVAILPFIYCFLVRNKIGFPNIYLKIELQLIWVILLVILQLEKRQKMAMRHPTTCTYTAEQLYRVQQHTSVVAANIFSRLLCKVENDGTNGQSQL